MANTDSYRGSTNLAVIFSAISAIKMLLIPSYHSTDFEVHRNWLAITHSLPIKEWYTDTSSEWTLDYPPLFAWFECGLSQLARYVDPAMLVTSNLNYCSWETVIFQRLSVIGTDLMLFYSVQQFGKFLLLHDKQHSENRLPLTIVSVLVLGNFGLFIVDHIHFQYNGLLFGILLLSVVRMLEGKVLWSAFWFSVLLNFKHIFLYVSPIYFIYLLKYYCFTKHTPNGRVVYRSMAIANLIKLATIVISVFALSFGPFISLGQFGVVLARLFPFRRGLCHAYWAPNFWAIYNVADKGLTVGRKYTGFIEYNLTQKASMTGGLVQEFSHSTMPTITPLITLLITGLSMLPVVWRIWSRKCDKSDFIRGLVLCAFGSFLFGWHVHEKAILLMIIPLTLLTVMNIGKDTHRRDVEAFVMLSITGHYSLFPLLFTKAESTTKVLLFILYTSFTLTTLQHISGTLKTISHCKRVYLMTLVPLYIFTDIIYYYALPVIQSSLPFLPLMIISLYTSLGISYLYVDYYYHFLVTKANN